MVDVGSRWRELRKKRGVTQRRLAASLRVSEHFLRNIESHGHRPTASAIISFAETISLSDSERLSLLEDIGYRVYPSTSFAAGSRFSDLQQALWNILDVHGMSLSQLAARLGTSKDALEQEFCLVLPSIGLLSEVRGLDLSDEESAGLNRAWMMQAAALAPWSPSFDRAAYEAESVGATLLELLGCKKGGDLSNLSERARGVLPDLMKKLDLNLRDIAKMLDANETEVKEWIRGSALIPLFVIARITEFNRGLTLLCTLFAEGRLAEIVRRPAPMFDGLTALDLIREGRIVAAAESYDRALTYQR